METIEKKKRRLIRTAFGVSKRGKIMSAIEWGIIYTLSTFVFSLLLASLVLDSHGKVSTKPLPLQGIVIFITLFGLVIGFFSGYQLGSSIFLWKIFKPSDQEVRTYIQDEIRRQETIIVDNKSYIQSLKEESAKTIASAEASTEEENREIELYVIELKGMNPV